MIEVPQQPQRPQRPNDVDRFASSLLRVITAAIGASIVVYGVSKLSSEAAWIVGGLSLIVGSLYGNRR